jgi:hypothetical protein
MAQAAQTEHPELDLSLEWPTSPAETVVSPELDKSVGRFGIMVRDTAATAYKRDKGDTGAKLTIPLIDLIGWIAQHWWALLYEPKKTDKPEEDAGFRSRHWMGTARHGFALPDLWFLPEGERVQIVAEPAYLRFARLQFTERVDESISTESVRDALSNFVDAVLKHMSDQGVITDAHKAWSLVKRTSPAAEQYCRLIGSLGLSPYDENGHIDQILEGVSDKLDPSILTDLFDASDLDGLMRATDLTNKMFDALPTASEINLAPFSDVELAHDFGGQAWRTGVESTVRIRTHLGVTNFDPSGGNAFFEALKFDPLQTTTVAADETSSGQISGALAREEEDVRVALAQTNEPQRRFAAARAIYLAMSEDRGSKRLVTRARTRGQQASRAFAAEMLAPIGYIRRRAGGDTISYFRVEEIARELCVSPQVVQYQARNNHIGVWTP